jgi:hypothetical protein
VVIAGLGITGTGLMGDLPLIIAFVILAAYTYSSGLRAPALIALVKDLLIFVTVIAAVVIIPAKLGGYGAVFAAVPKEKLNLAPAQYGSYATLALGSALALFLYPHSITGVLSSSGRKVIKRNAAFLPAYSFLLGLIALLGYMAIAAGIKPDPTYGSQWAVPALFDAMFPDWFTGVAFAAIAIGALVPAAIMSIASANLFSRNIYKEYLRRDASPRDEARMAKLASLVVKFGALVFIVALENARQEAIDFQLSSHQKIHNMDPRFLGDDGNMDPRFRGDDGKSGGHDVISIPHVILLHSLVLPPRHPRRVEHRAPDYHHDHVRQERVERAVPAQIQSADLQRVDCREVLRCGHRGASRHSHQPAREQRPAVEPARVQAEDHRGECLQDPDAPQKLEVDSLLARVLEREYEHQRAELHHQRRELRDPCLVAR